MYFIIIFIRQEDEAENIENVAYEARNTSSEAVMLARKAVDDQRDITDMIKVTDGLFFLTFTQITKHLCITSPS